MYEEKRTGLNVERLSFDLTALKGEFVRLFSDGKPLGKLFATEENFYYYDTGTNKLFSFDEMTFLLLKCLLDCGDIENNVDGFIRKNGNAAFLEIGGDVLSAIRNEKILLLKRVSNFNLSPHFKKSFIDYYHSKIESLMLEITESCNLRCNYCVYGEHNVAKRNHTQRSMTSETAFKAIDFYEKCSGESGKKPAIYFYGGEPILNFQLLNQCVEYAKSKFQEDVKFGLTTNCTLITSEIAQYLSDNNFFIVVSLDGPKDIHDEHRKGGNGKGSFHNVMEGLQHLFNVFGNRSETYISLNIVYSPPFSEQKIKNIDSFVNDPSIFPKNIKSKISYVRELPRYFFEKMERKTEPVELMEQKSVGNWGFEQFKNLPIESNFLGKDSKLLLTAQFLQRPVFNEPVDEVFLNGTCMPGIRRLYITTKGEFHICEKISNKLPSIGNVVEGFNYNTITEFYIEKYAKKSIPYCSTCWAARLCSLCYAHSFNAEGRYDMKMKESNCNSCRAERESFLKNFCEIKEVDPKRLDYLNEYEFS